MQRSELDRGLEILLNCVVNHDRFAKALAAVNDAMGGRLDAVRDRVERIDLRCGSVGLDDRELQAR